MAVPSTHVLRAKTLGVDDPKENFASGSRIVFRRKKKCENEYCTDETMKLMVDSKIGDESSLFNPDRDIWRNSGRQKLFSRNIDIQSLFNVSM